MSSSLELGSGEGSYNAALKQADQAASVNEVPLYDLINCSVQEGTRTVSVVEAYGVAQGSN